MLALENLEDVYDRMPSVGHARMLAHFGRRVENRYDSKALAQWFGIIIACFGAVIGFAIALYELVTSGMIYRFYHNNTEVALVLTGSVGAIFLLLLTNFLKRILEDRKFIAADTLNDFKILQMITICFIESPEKTTYIYRYWLRARRTNAGLFKMKVGWSSDMNALSVNMRSECSGYNFENTNQVGYKMLVVNIGKQFAKNHKEIVEFELQCDTTNFKRADPVLSISVASPKFPRLNTFLGLAVLKGVDVTGPHRKVYFSPLVDHAFRSDAVQLKDGWHLWPIITKAGWKYALSWSYKEK